VMNLRASMGTMLGRFGVSHESQQSELIAFLVGRSTSTSLCRYTFLFKNLRGFVPFIRR
jgi:hypothetical protein